MENMTKAFEEFLRDRLSVDIGSGFLKKWSKEELKWVGDIDIEQEIENAGGDKDKAVDLHSLIWVGIGDIAEEAYVNGVKEGFHLALHLLDMVPENRKEVSQ